MPIQKLYVSILSFFFLFTVVSCRTVPISEQSQEEGITRIRDEFEDKNWSDVVSNVDEYKARYPYSKNLPEAELMQANAYYLSGKYPEAIAAYEDFARRNPIDKNVSFVQYRIANSNDLQASEEIDREQVSARKAIIKYSFYVKNYPNAEYIPEATERIKVLTRRLAEHEMFIARFYWRKDLYSAALNRYLEILTKFPQYDDLKLEAKERAAVCYEEMADFLEENPDSDQYAVIKNVKPNDLRQKAKEILSIK
ncbi:outer membrane protein assembly factor BamD [Pigmentibacter sp. JX0631]|uniref:outer membrane protein assembly factor BamD n=1 Tax=Pigmentibacter sp. JX0631 TaxID=2976982 RepID=UPI0024690827|nr:outer membrane protein assembly factor BamD [Pigmentibacter sp. JX0631]WGL60990.1 outer membrane protein assembly factor BamD [Pigmentibacter sp. JX0631]